jgi:capsid protein
MSQARTSKILDADGNRMVVLSTPEGNQYESMPTWMARHWEAAETTRLNSAHWTYAVAADRSINDWLSDQLTEVRARSIYESRQNGTISGMVGTLADDVVGPDGPSLEIQSDNEEYNNAAEAVWKEWFKAPTFRPNVSGASLLRLWVENLPRCGEFIAQIATDNRSDGPVKMRIRPKHARELVNPMDRAGDPRLVMGVEFESTELDRPQRYWFSKPSVDGYSTVTEPWPPDLVIHEFLLKEEKQARGFPWLTPSLQPAADLRDYDDQVQDASRQMADQFGMLYNENPDEVWPTPESSTVERRTIKMAPPGWKPFVYTAGPPPVQYPDYRAERQREIGRPMSMPLMIMRLDASRHNYSSARFDGQGWARFVRWVQYFISGTDKSYGTLNRLVDLVLAEARFKVPALRIRPTSVVYQWTWPVRPHVDPLKEAAASEKRLLIGTATLTSELAENGVTLDSHIRTRASEIKKYKAAGLPLPAHMGGGETATTEIDPEEDDDKEDAKAAENRAIDDARHLLQGA